eukprot:TRINITY_DN7156_c0_g1_i1.p2 TRINITY_DN7156_c0_g1~~TRINITY_DN7156_c0_g1_i1.p2  ORF type:complete len:461 (-),score=94.08 TRINITY_DN7156_c0_g1_i1:1124-2485(-)
MQSDESLKNCKRKRDETNPSPDVDDAPPPYEFEDPSVSSPPPMVQEIRPAEFPVQSGMDSWKKKKRTRTKKGKKGVQLQQTPQQQQTQTPQQSQQQQQQPETQPQPQGQPQSESGRSKASRMKERGNYEKYYGYRLLGEVGDRRLECLQQEWFAGKTALDIGCNSGCVTIGIAEKFHPKMIVGVDFDKDLIDKANESVKRVVLGRLKQNQRISLTKITTKNGPTTITTEQKEQSPSQIPETPDPKAISESPSSSTSLPISVYLKSTHDPSTAPILTDSSSFPRNISFVCEDFMDGSEECEKYSETYDTILCLSVTKWIHLNFGDEGIRRLFRKAYALLKTGGVFILEPQLWKGYKKRSHISQTTKFNFKNAKLRPNEFSDVLMNEIGFSAVDFLYIPSTMNGFDRPIYASYKKHRLDDQTRSLLKEYKENQQQKNLFRSSKHRKIHLASALHS